MPIHDVGYRGWDGKRTTQLSRWGIIAQTGIRLAAKSRWVRRILFVAWLPVMYWGVAFFFVEKQLDSDKNLIAVATQEIVNRVPKQENIEQLRNADRNRLRKVLTERFAMVPHARELANALDSEDTGVLRNNIWRWLLMVFFRYSQAILILFLVGVVAPSLIAKDIRSRAFLLYFSRPIGKIEYIFGKLCVPGAFIIATTTFPALVLYLFAILMSPNIAVIANTWDIPIRIILASLALVIPTVSVALMLSSLTQESRFANFSWFAIWALGHGAWMAVVVATAVRLDKPPFEPEVLGNTMVQNWSVLSLYNCLGDVQEWIFGFETFTDVWRAVAVLTMLTMVSLWILYRRVSAPIKI